MPKRKAAPRHEGCRICHLHTDLERLLVCENQLCGAEYHLYCLTPPLKDVPASNWYCPPCMEEFPTLAANVVGQPIRVQWEDSVKAFRKRAAYQRRQAKLQGLPPPPKVKPPTNKDGKLGKRWFSGRIVRYNAKKKTHRVKYDEPEQCSDEIMSLYHVTFELVTGLVWAKFRGGAYAPALQIMYAPLLRQYKKQHEDNAGMVRCRFFDATRTCQWTPLENIHPYGTRIVGGKVRGRRSALSLCHAVAHRCHCPLPTFSTTQHLPCWRQRPRSAKL